MSKLKEQRTAAGISQTELSAAAGVNRQMISFYEQGFKDINKAQAITVFKLAKAIGCQMEDLIEPTNAD